MSRPRWCRGRTGRRPGTCRRGLRGDGCIREDSETLPAVRLLTAHAEAPQSPPWQVEDAGERLPNLLSRIISFRATVHATDARFKLGQEEDVDVLREILAAYPDPVMAGWMRRLNADRLQTDDAEAIIGETG
jgi:transcriptional regulator